MAGPSVLDALDRIATWVGFLALLVAFLAIALAADGTPGFAVTADSVPILGRRSAPRTDTFNLGIMAAGLLGTVFTVRVSLAVEHPVQQAGALLFTAAAVALTLLGVFPVGSPSGIGYPMAMAVGVLVTVGLPVFASGEALAGQPTGAVVTLWMSMVTMAAWFAWALADDVAGFEAGLAVPELALGVALLGWAFPATNRIRSER